MFARYAVSGLAAFFTLVGLYAACVNPQAVSVSLFGAQHEVALAVVIASALASGVAGGLAYLPLLAGKAKSEKRKLEWDAQDAKLEAEIKSDREKQLEAKIATLESALKQALKKS